MAKLIIESEKYPFTSQDPKNLKSRHADSFRFLKKHGYELHYQDKGVELYRHPDNYTAHIKNDGTWRIGHWMDGDIKYKGKSHSDLAAILKKVHK